MPASEQDAPRGPRQVVHKLVVSKQPSKPRVRFALQMFVAVFVGIFAFYLASKSVWRPFCDTGLVPGMFNMPLLCSFCSANALCHAISDSENECIPCPKRAECNDGYAKCARGLVLQGTQCVDDPEVVLLSEDMYADVVVAASQRLGEAECGLRDKDNVVISLTELEQLLRPQYGSDAHFEEAWSKVRFRIMMADEKNTDLRHSRDKGVWSVSPKKPLTCLVKHWFVEQRAFIFMVMTALLLILYLVRRKRIVKRQHEEASIIFKRALLLLKDSSGPFALDHLYEHSFEQSGLRKDPAVWKLV